MKKLSIKPHWAALVMVLGAALVMLFVKLTDHQRAENKREECVANMKRIDGAMHSWSLATKADAGLPADPNGIASFQKGGVLPQCPSGGSHTMIVGSNVVCSIHGTLDY